MIAATGKPKRVWRECRLGDHVLINSRSIDKNYPHTEIEYLDTGSITQGKIETLQHFQLADAPSRAKRVVKDDDIVLSTVRPIQRHYGFLKNVLPNMVASTGFVVLTCKNDIDPYFLYSFLTQEDTTEYLDMIAEGATSTYPAFTPDVVENISINLPPLPEQCAIAAVLSSLDDKIDLLHRQNKTLESLASALWRKMFIEEAAPSWKERSLLEIIDLVGGGTPKTDVPEYWGGVLPWLSAKDITANHQSFIIHTEKTISKLGLENSSAKLLPKYSTIISARGTVGNYCILSSPMTFSQSNYGVLPKIDGCYFFTYLLIAFAVAELKSVAYGSVFDTITTNTFRDQKIILPAEDEILSFEKLIKPYFESVYNNTTQIHTLSRLRDTLLPKLMSGEARVKL